MLTDLSSRWNVGVILQIKEVCITVIELFLLLVFTKIIVFTLFVKCKLKQLKTNLHKYFHPPP